MTHTLTPRVYYVDPVGGHRGMHYYDFALCHAIQACGTQITLLTCDETATTQVPGDLALVFPFRGIYGSAPAPVRGVRYLRGLLQIARAIMRDHVPVVHLHFPQFLPADYLLIQWLQRRGRRIVLTAHDVMPLDGGRVAQAWLPRLYERVDAIIVHAQDNYETLVEQFHVPETDVTVIPMGPYLTFAKDSQFPAAEARASLGLETDQQVILFFGQLKKAKGLACLIRAFAQLRADFPQARLVIAGPEWDEKFSPYRRLIDDLDLGEYVQTRIEYVPDEEVGVYFSAADVVALPYVKSYQSAVLYMAYSFARPVVATSVGGLREVVRDGVTGLLVPPQDSEALAHALHRLLAAPAETRAMGDAGRRLVEGEFGWTSIAERTVAVYRRVMATQAPALFTRDDCNESSELR